MRDQPRRQRGKEDDGSEKIAILSDAKIRQRSRVTLIASVAALVVWGAPVRAELPECVAILTTPEFEAAVFKPEGGSSDLASDRRGSVLLGSACTVAALIDLFVSAGWEHVGTSTYQTLVRAGPLDRRYEYDQEVAFCRVRPLLQRLLLTRCGPNVGFTLAGDRITHINAGLSK